MITYLVSEPFAKNELGPKSVEDFVLTNRNLLGEDFEHCQANGAKSGFSPKRQESHNLSKDARHLSPIGKSPGSEESMMNRFKMMTTDLEQVLNGTVNCEKTLSLCH